MHKESFAIFAVMVSAQIYYHGFHLFYEKTGTGNKALVVFHGYGQETGTWKKFLEPLEAEYCIYLFHLFGHGKSKIEEHAMQRGIDHQDWQKIFNEFLIQESLERFHLIAYSLGAKLGLLTAEFFSAKIKDAIFLAPDGVKPDYAQIIFLRNQPGRWLLNWFHHHPGVLNQSLHLVKKAGIINHRAHQYFVQQTESMESRNFVLHIWYAYRKLRPNIRRTMLSCAKNKTSFFVLYGNRDSLIHRKYIEGAIKQWPKALEGFYQMHETGHNLLIPEVQKSLKKILLKEINR